MPLIAHLLAGLGAGLLAVFIDSPVNVVGSIPVYSFFFSLLRDCT